jgi:CRISPR-associated endonuclease/helicase Cas3
MSISDFPYWAHSAKSPTADPSSRLGWQPLAVHLEAVAALAGDLAASARPGDERFAALARLSGLLHDYGKYTDCFQRRLATGSGRCQHAIHGALLAYLGTGATGARPALSHVAAAIAGHHAGLPDFSGDGSTLKSRLNDGRYIKEATDLFERAARDCSGLRQAIEMLPQLRLTAQQPEATRLDLCTRMLCSCLADADRLDSAGRAPEEAPLHAEERLSLLLAHLEALARRSSDGPLKNMRSSVLDDCLQAASSPSRLFSLSVPTGGGKTLAAMAFALRRAAVQPVRFRRVIVVIPFLSIIEQNAAVYRSVLGPDAILEHHSGSTVKLQRHTEEQFVPAAQDDEEDQFQRSGLRNATENWDAPLIVTTSVRFFESLFSNHPGDLRRVHNIARSIVILDEVQTLPRRLLGPLLGMIRELADDWGVDFVFSTATQPAFERRSPKPDLRWEPGTLTEIVCDPAPLRTALKRAEIHWEIEHAVTWSQVAERALRQPQCLAIVNLRDHAGELYREVLRAARERGIDAEAAFHLSTRMCAAHRLRKLDQIRQRLRDGKPCYVVSTQLVEAGVDVDFPLVLRALAPLDSIVQAAGRADREGRLTAQLGRPGGEVVVFLPEDNRMPPHEYAEAAGFTKAMANEAIESGTSIQVDSAKAMTDYFERYYGESGVDLGKKLVDLRQEQCFATLAREFEMISSRARDVFVPDDDEARKAIEELYANKLLTRELRHRLQRHTVGLNPSEFQKASHVLCELTPDSEVWIAVEQGYNDELGLVFESGPESLIVSSPK